MRLRFLAPVFLLLPALLPAQKETQLSLIPPQSYPDVKQYLGLTDAQMQSLQTIQDSRSRALQALYEQIGQKNQALYQLVNSDTGTAAQIGQLMLDIRALEKQIPLADGPYKTQSINVLTPEQKAKLPKLVEAASLQPAAGQAGSLLLIDWPQYRILPAGGAPGLGMPEAISAVRR
jgi:Spy/CpxP family protein refolding chaperone